MNQVTSEPVLTIEEEQAIGRRIQKGDGAALNSLVVANQRFATYMASRYRRQDVEMDDLIQEANMGLLLAARHFDPDRGVRFSTYAAWWIEAQLRRYLRRHKSVVRFRKGPNCSQGVCAGRRRSSCRSKLT
jgi:DNA-directed RNA polymerase sigma subunit (sigma70/sigma32)